jgi:hypothetical protein
MTEEVRSQRLDSRRAVQEMPRIMPQQPLGCVFRTELRMGLSADAGKSAGQPVGEAVKVPRTI